MLTSGPKRPTGDEGWESTGSADRGKIGRGAGEGGGICGTGRVRLAVGSRSWMLRDNQEGEGGGSGVAEGENSTDAVTAGDA